MILLAFWGNILPTKTLINVVVPTKFSQRGYELRIRATQWFQPDLKGSEQNRCSFLKGSSAFLVNKWMVCFLKGYLKFYHESVFFWKFGKRGRWVKMSRFQTGYFPPNHWKKEWKIEGQVMCLPNKHCHLFKVYWEYTDLPFWKKWETMKTSPKVYLDVLFWVILFKAMVYIIGEYGVSLFLPLFPSISKNNTSQCFFSFFFEKKHRWRGNAIAATRMTLFF